MHVCMSVCMYVRMYVCMYACINVCMCVCMYTCKMKFQQEQKALSVLLTIGVSGDPSSSYCVKYVGRIRVKNDI